MPTAMPLTLPRAILFDMDGTLTQPMIDYDAIKRDIGISSGPILEGILKMPEVKRIEAEAILHRHEDSFAKQSALNPGCEELLHWVEKTGLKTALVTRNTRASVRTVFDLHGLHFDVCITREDGKYKPDPAPLQLACDRLGVAAGDAWMIGDSRHDIEAAAAAGMTSVWISHGSGPDFIAEPTMVVNGLPALKKLLEGLSR